MVDPAVRRDVDGLLAAVRSSPDALPVRELAALRRHGVDVGIDLTREDAVVYVSPRRDERLAVLTPRERDVATLTAAGFSNEQIATALFVSIATVKDHLHSIFTRTGFRSRAQLIAAWYGGYEEPNGHTPVDQRGDAMPTVGSPASSGDACEK